MRNINPIFVLIFLLLSFVPVAAQRKNVDLIISGGTIVTVDKQNRVIENGAIAIRGTNIVGVDSASAIARQFISRKTIFANGKVIIPGLINTHTHVPMTLFRGIADDLDLQDWLTKYIFPAEAKNVNEEFVRAGTRLGLAEMIRGGTTTYCDMYYFEDAIAEETSKAGVRGVLGETLIDFPVPDNKTFAEALSYTEKFVKRWKGNSLIVAAIAPHAPYTVSKEHLLETRKLSDELDAPLIIHLAEANTETDFIQKNHQGMRPIQYVEQIGFLSDKTIAAHVIQANDSELEILKRRGVGIAHNPSSNMKLAAGIAPIPLMLSKEMRVGLGTDGAASNNDLDMWEEMDLAAKLHKVSSGDPKAVNAQQAFSMATIGGARALHLDKIIGSIETGKRADIVIVDFNSLHQTPVYNVFSHLVYTTKASDVRTVVINGAIVMLDRTLITLNENAIRNAASRYHQKIIKSLTSN